MDKYERYYKTHLYSPKLLFFLNMNSVNLLIIITNKLINKLLFLERIPFEKYEGHIKFVKDVCNKNRPKTFSNLDDAGNSCHEFFKRLHETKIPKNKKPSNVPDE